MEVMKQVVSHRCRPCRRDLPLTAEYFHRHSGHKSGFREICRECRSQRRKQRLGERYGRAEKTLLLRLARDVLNGRCSEGHMQVYAVLSNILGGADGIARGLAQLTSSPATKPRTAVTIYNSILSLCERQSEAQQRAAEEKSKQIQQLPREGLEEHMLELFDQLMRGHGYKLVPIDSA
jgi:hypothetical protein